MEMCSSYRCAVTQPQALQLCPGQNAVPTVQCCSVKQAHSRQYVTAVTPMEMCSSYRCAVTQPQCAAARFRAEWSPQCSVLLCKTGSQQAVCRCSHIYGEVLFIQVCSDPAPMHCSSVQGKMQSPLFSAALQNRLKSRECVTAYALMEKCSSYRCAVTQPQCAAARFRAKWSPHCSVLLCKTGSQQAVCHCSHIYGEVLFIQVCNDPAPMHCSSVQGKMQSPLFSAALQNRIRSRECVSAYAYMEMC